MRWQTSSGSEEFGHTTTLLYQGRIVATQETPLWDVGVLFQWTRKGRIVTDHLMRDFPFPERDSTMANSGLIVDFLRARPERPAQIWGFRETVGTRPSRAWGCPATAQLVRIMNVPTDLGFTAAMAADTGRRLAAMRATGRPLAPLVVLADTVFLYPDEASDDGLPPDTLDDHMDGALFGGVAVNTTGDTLHDAAVWYAIDSLPAASGPDTVVYFLGDVAPHALAAFAGGPGMARRHRIARGIWIDAGRVAGVTAAFGHSLHAFLERNGQPPSTVPEDEIPQPPPPPPRVFDPANIDLFVLAIGADVMVAARERASTAGDTLSQLVLVVPGCCDPNPHLLRDVRAGVSAPADTATATLVETTGPSVDTRMRAVLAALEKGGWTVGRLPSSDGAYALPAPGAELFVLAFPTERRGAILRYPIGHPPAALDAAVELLDSLSRARLPDLHR